MSKCTPGPWEVSDNPRETTIVGKNGSFICEVQTHLLEEELANARLIAAAPELLDACKKVKSYLISHPDNWNTGVLHTLYLAIKKAEAV
jgi:hypothetical protein